jgi:hypothetical protein
VWPIPSKQQMIVRDFGSAGRTCTCLEGRLLVVFLGQDKERSVGSEKCKKSCGFGRAGRIGTCREEVIFLGQDRERSTSNDWSLQMTVRSFFENATSSCIEAHNIHGSMFYIITSYSGNAGTSTRLLGS